MKGVLFKNGTITVHTQPFIRRTDSQANHKQPYDSAARACRKLPGSVTSAYESWMHRVTTWEHRVRLERTLQKCDGDIEGWRDV
jgi:hypothetical protein